MRIRSLLSCLLCLLPLFALSQTRTVGRLHFDDSLALHGYTLFGPNQTEKTFLINNCGQLVQEWTGTFQPAMLSYLREDGLLLRSGRDFSNNNFQGVGGNGGWVELLDWNSNVQWKYKLSDADRQAHHDIEPLPNGNVLLLAWEKFNFDDCVAAGRNPASMSNAEVWAEAVYEIKPIFPDSGEIVWEWHIWDHLVQDFDSTKSNYGPVADHPEWFDLNYLGTSNGHPDWLHANSIAYNKVRDEIILSLREPSELIVIDHSTNTLQASGHTGGISGQGGDILFRWGNPAAYQRGDSSDQELFHQHDARWIESGLPGAGQITVFNNGDIRPGMAYSSVDFLVPEIDLTGHYVVGTGPISPSARVRSFASTSNNNFDSNIMAGAHMLANGNLLVTQAVQGRFLEFDSLGAKAWEYVSPAIALGAMISQGQTVPVLANSWANAVFRAHKYAANYPGLAGRALLPGDPLESFPFPDSCSVPLASENEMDLEGIACFPNPFANYLQIRSASSKPLSYRILDAKGEIVLQGKARTGLTTLSTQELPAGIYFLKVENMPGKLLTLQR